MKSKYVAFPTLEPENVNSNSLFQLPMLIVCSDIAVDFKNGLDCNTANSLQFQNFTVCQALAYTIALNNRKKSH